MHEFLLDFKQWQMNPKESIREKLLSIKYKEDKCLASCPSSANVKDQGILEQALKCQKSC